MRLREAARWAAPYPGLALVLVAAMTPAAMVAAPAGAADNAAWSTFLRVRSFTDLIATRDTVWAATGEAGLLIFDRTESLWSTVRRQPGGIASNELSALAFDPSGRLWVGTRAAGVSRLAADGSGWDLVNTFDGLPVDSVTVLEAVGDSMWIGTKRGIALWNGREISGSLPDVNTVSFDTTFRVPTITGVVQLGDELWLSSPRGVGFAHLSSSLTDWRPANQGLPSPDVPALASDGSRLFALSNNAVYQLVAGEWQFTGTVTGFVSHLTDDAGAVLVTGQIGVLVWGPSGWMALAGSPAAFPEKVEPALDPAGQAIAGFRDTLYQQQVDRWDHIAAPEGPPGNDLLNVDVDGSRVYVTTTIEGVGRFDGTHWRHWLPGSCPGGCDTTFNNPSFAFALLVDREHRKWVGCWSSALERFSDEVSPPSFTHFFIPGGLANERHTWAKAAAEDTAGGIWFGMDTNCKGCSDAQNPIGLEHYNADGSYAANFNPQNSELQGALVHAVASTRNGRMWVGTDGQGASFFDLPAGNAPPDFTLLTSTTSQHQVIRGIAVYDAVDSVWMLTPSSLLRFSARALASASPSPVLTHPGGISDGATRPIDVARDGTVWVATDAGVLAYPRRGTLEWFHTGNSPLAGNNVRAVRVDPTTGAVWFATTAGLSRYDPGYRPPVPGAGARLDIRVYPNPITQNGLGVQLRLSGGAASYRGAVYDIGGRRVHEFEVPANGRVIWNGRDQDGRLVKPGIYFVRAQGNGREASARVVLLR